MVNEKCLIFLRPKLTMCIEYEKKAQNNSSGIVSNSPGFKFSGTFQMLFLSHAS